MSRSSATATTTRTTRATTKPIGRGALAYLVAGLIEEGMDPAGADLTALDIWPWHDEMFRPTDYYGCLVKVAAMCIAEADRVMIARALIERVQA